MISAHSTAEAAETRRLSDVAQIQNPFSFSGSRRTLYQHLLLPCGTHVIRRFGVRSPCVTCSPANASRNFSNVAPSAISM